MKHKFIFAILFIIIGCSSQKEIDEYYAIQVEVFNIDSLINELYNDQIQNNIFMLSDSLVQNNIDSIYGNLENQADSMLFNFPKK